MTEPTQPTEPTVAPAGRRRRLVIAGIVGVVAAFALLLALRACTDSGPEVVRAVAAGDMVCDPGDPAQGGEKACKAKEVSDVAVGLNPDAFFGLGDYVYEVPKSDTYRTVYDPSWGRLKEKTLPAIGNQEYKVHEANTFRSYFGDRAGPESGYWSTQFGKWHVVVLNSNRLRDPGGPQRRRRGVHKCRNDHHGCPSDSLSLTGRSVIRVRAQRHSPSAAASSAARRLASKSWA